MRIEERIVIPKPKMVLNGSKQYAARWVGRIISHKLWSIRSKYIIERGVDIFNVFTMTDCIEFTLSGDMDVLPWDKERVMRYKSKKWKRKRNVEEDEA